MKLEKAIEVIENILDSVEPGDPQEEQDALELGIEALKAVKDARVNNYYTPIAPLSGETKS